MHELKVFENPEFRQVRVVEIDNSPWFSGKDICQFFGDTNHNRTLSRVDNLDKRTIEINDSMGRIQKAIFVNESGMYSILFTMQPEKANKDGVSDAYPIETQERIAKLKKFKHWVTSEVLPSIRRHGVYAIEELINDPDLALKALSALREERKKTKALQADNERMKPKEIFADAVAASNTTILIGDLAKILKQNSVDIGQKRLFEQLREGGYLIKDGSSRNMPTQKAMELGLFEIIEKTITKPDGSLKITRTTKVTGKGQQYFINKYLKTN